MHRSAWEYSVNHVDESLGLHTTICRYNLLCLTSHVPRPFLWNRWPHIGAHFALSYFSTSFQVQNKVYGFRLHTSVRTSMFIIFWVHEWWAYFVNNEQMYALFYNLSKQSGICARSYLNIISLWQNDRSEWFDVIVCDLKVYIVGSHDINIQRDELDCAQWLTSVVHSVVSSASGLNEDRHWLSWHVSSTSHIGAGLLGFIATHQMALVAVQVALVVVHMAPHYLQNGYRCGIGTTLKCFR